MTPWCSTRSLPNSPDKVRGTPPVAVLLPHQFLKPSPLLCCRCSRLCGCCVGGRVRWGVHYDAGSCDRSLARVIPCACCVSRCGDCLPSGLTSRTLTSAAGGGSSPLQDRRSVHRRVHCVLRFRVDLIRASPHSVAHASVHGYGMRTRRCHLPLWHNTLTLSVWLVQLRSSSEYEGEVAWDR